MDSQAAPTQERAVLRGPATARTLSADLPRRSADLRASLRTRLVVAFVAMVALMVALGILGLRVLGDANDRVEVLGALQLRATAYRELGTEADQLRLLLGLRAGGGDLAVWLGGTPGSAPGGSTLDFIDQTIATALTRLGQSADSANLGFVPPADEEQVLVQVRQDQAALVAVIARIIAFDKAGNPVDGLSLQHAEAEPLAQDLESRLSGLTSSTLARTTALITQNRDDFARSRDLFFGVAIVSVVAALLLGYLLSRTVIAPIRAVQNRVAAIAAGDFSGHVAVPRQDELGSLAANVNRMNDELGRLYRELETASRHKSEFLANMSHELRTPLNAIIGFSEVLSEQMFGDLNPRQLEYMEDITSSSRHLLALINDVLDLSKVEAGRMELNPTVFSLREVLEDGLTMVGERAARNDISLRLDVEVRDDAVEADERKVKQVVFNLLSNAVKFTSAGGHVTVSARDDGDGGIRIDVADDGIGVAPDDQARIFDTFAQVGGSATGAQEGTGLGLGLARSFVELHGGRMALQSTPGQGSTFTVFLPNRQPSATRT